MEWIMHIPSNVVFCVMYHLNGYNENILRQINTVIKMFTKFGGVSVQSQFMGETEKYFVNGKTSVT